MVRRSARKPAQIGEQTLIFRGPGRYRWHQRIFFAIHRGNLIPLKQVQPSVERQKLCFKSVLVFQQATNRAAIAQTHGSHLEARRNSPAGLLKRRLDL